MTKYIPPTIWTGNHAAWGLVLNIRVDIEFEYNCKSDIDLGLLMVERYLLYGKKRP